MDTLAVVCDDYIECAEERDEADKYNPIAYAMTAGTCMVYVVLKLVWFFHQRHELLEDEDNDEDMVKFASTSNQEQEVKYYIECVNKNRRAPRMRRMTCKWMK